MISQAFEIQYYKYIEDLNLSEEQLKEVKICTFSPKEFICHEGDTLHYLMIMISGNAKVTISAPNGKTLLLSFLKSYGIIGDIELLSKKKASSNVIALAELKVIAIPYSILNEHLKHVEKEINFLFKDLTNKIGINSKQAVINNLYSLTNRVCGYIYSTNYKMIFSENLTETSELLGTSYRHLLRVLKELCDKKVLEHVEKGIYKILDLEKLDILSDGCYR